MAPRPSVKIVKQFSYRQSVKFFSNRYHFTNDSPAGDTEWHVFLDAIRDLEKNIYSDQVAIVKGYGYDAGSDLPVQERDWDAAGILDVSESASQCPGDCAALLRYSTDGRTAKNHPIYLFNYFHGVYADTFAADEQDLIFPGQKSAIEDYASSWIDGISDGSVSHARCGPNGDIGRVRVVEDYITHRDFPR